ncbi:hypothetical protein CPC08DRAFT_69684 [Agrocybe pediades]|nr:hypothetical protein CPC08DRAFT_69684 [Agrocybe pediades]
MGDNCHNIGNYTTTSSNAFSMITGTNVLITGVPKLATINDEYNWYENNTHTTIVNSNNVIGSMSTEALDDNSQVIYGKGRGMTRRARKRRYEREKARGNGEHQGNFLLPVPFPFLNQFLLSYFPGPPNSTTSSSGYDVQKFPPSLADPLSSFLESTTSFHVAPGGVEGMGEQSSQLFSRMFDALEAEHFLRAKSSTTIALTLPPPASYDNSTESTTYMDLTSGSSCSTLWVDNRTAPIEAGTFPPPLATPLSSFTHSAGGIYEKENTRCIMPTTNINSNNAIGNVLTVTLYNTFQTTYINQSRMKVRREGRYGKGDAAEHTVSPSVQSNYAPSLDNLSTMLNSIIQSAASMPDNNVQTSSGLPPIETSSSTHSYVHPAASATSTSNESPVPRSPSHDQAVPSAYRQTTISGIGAVQIAPGARINSTTGNGSRAEVNHRQTTFNYGMSGMSVGNTVTHVRNVVGKESMMKGDVREDAQSTRKHDRRKQGVGQKRET